MYAGTDPRFAGGRMNDKKLEPFPTLFVGRVWSGFFNIKSRILSHTLYTFLIFHTICNDHNHTR